MSITLASILTVIILAAGAAFVYLQKRRTDQLKARFGPEYDRTVREIGDRPRAEKALQKRQERIEGYKIQPLSADDRDFLAKEWQRTQAMFVDNPAAAVQEADRLICEAMRRSGYPMSDFELRAEDLSVEHPHVVKNYRAAHEIATAEGETSTEDLRQAMVYYHELFDELLETQPTGSVSRK